MKISSYLLLLLLTSPWLAAQSHQETRTYSLLPNQSFIVENGSATRIELHAQFPLRIFNGHCKTDYAVQFYCENPQPHDLVFIDTRSPSVFKSPQANTITVTFSN